MIKSRIHPFVWDKIGQAKKEFSYTRKRYHCDDNLVPIFQEFLSKANGFYVDIGANDGRAASNTYHLEKSQNWSGILVEPVLHLYFRSREIRDLNRNVFFNCACVSTMYAEKTVELLYSGMMTISTDSTFNPREWAESGSKFLGSGEVVTKICSQARTLESILIEANAPTRIDLLSIDVEGAELSVLNGVNFANYIFEYILIETTQGSKAFLELVNQGYVYLKSIDQNILFMHSSLANTK